MRACVYLFFTEVALLSVDDSAVLRASDHDDSHPLQDSKTYVSSSLQGYNNNKQLPVAGQGVTLAPFHSCRSSNDGAPSGDYFHGAINSESNPINYKCSFAFDGNFVDSPYTSWAVRETSSNGPGASPINAWIHVRFQSTMTLRHFTWQQRGPVSVNGVKKVRLQFGWKGWEGVIGLNPALHDNQEVILGEAGGVQTIPLLFPVVTDGVRVTVLEVYGHADVSTVSDTGHKAEYGHGATEIGFYGWVIVESWVYIVVVYPRTVLASC